MGVVELKAKAKDAFRKRRYELAVDMYTEALRFEPNDRESVEGFFQAARKARESKGKALLGGMFSKVSVGTNRDPRKRIEACLRGLAKRPEDKGLLVSLGEAAGQAEAEEMAIAAYQIATEIDAEDALVWKYLGDYLGRVGRIKEALAALGKSVDLDPKDQEAQKLRKNLAAEGALQKGRYHEAASTRELMKDQDEARRLEADRRIQLTPEHAAQEIEHLREKMAENPDHPKIRVRLAELLLNMGDEDEALAVLKEAVRLDPQNFDLGIRVGDMELRHFQAEARDSKAAAEANPDDADLMAKRDAAMKTFLEAQKVEYTRRVKEHPMDLAERFRLGRTLLALGDLDLAAAEFQQTVRDPRRKTESLLLLAKAFDRKKLVGLAIKKLEEALEDFPTPTSPQAKDVHYAYADLLERSGDIEKAKAAFETIFEVDITFRDVSKRLETLTS